MPTAVGVRVDPADGVCVAPGVVLPTITGLDVTVAVGDGLVAPTVGDPVGPAIGLDGMTTVPLLDEVGVKPGGG